MIMPEALASVFSIHLNPDFQFRDETWIAVAFERNAYDNTRMPEWFFRVASHQFARSGAVGLLIQGDYFSEAGLSEVTVEPFEWSSYQEFMLRPEAYSLEYRMASSDLQCGVWADADITVFGGEPTLMTAVIDELGGANVLLEHMRQEFLLGDISGYQEMDEYFQRLLFPGLRKAGGASAP